MDDYIRIFQNKGYNVILLNILSYVVTVFVICAPLMSGIRMKPFTDSNYSQKLPQEQKYIDSNYQWMLRYE